MNLNLKIEAKARFMLETFKEGSEKLQNKTGWFDNIVLDKGLDRMKTDVWFDGISVGEGQSTPTETQTALGSYINRTTSTVGSPIIVLSTDGNGKKYVSKSMKYRFAAGAAAGNVSEVALSWGTGSNIWNRALVKNSSGDPVTITVLSDEYLDVSVETRFYLGDTTGTIQILDGVGNVSQEVTYTMKGYYRSLIDGNTFRLWHQYCQTFSGDVINDTTTPTGFLATAIGTLSSTNTNPHENSTNFLIDIGSTSLPIKSMLLGTAGFGVSPADGSPSFGFSCQFSEAIVKGPTERLNFTTKINWGRYIGV